MSNKQIDSVRLIIYLISFISLVIQLFVFENNNDLYCIFIIFFSNILTTFYCLNKKYFFKYPISLLMIFISYFINLGGALFFKSFEFTLITEKLDLPLSTILILTTINITIILSHSLYRKINESTKTNKINNFLIKIDFFKIGDVKFLYFLSFIVVASKLFFFDLNRTISAQGEFGYNPNLFQDIVNGLKYVIYLPVVIFFSKSLFEIDHVPKKYFFFILFLLSIAFISLSRSNRSILFDCFLLSAIVVFILILFDRINLKKNFFIKLILLPLLIIPSFNIIENLSKQFVTERSLYMERTPIENVKSFIENAFSKKNNNLYLEKKYLSDQIFFSENYYKSSLFNRANILHIHDNFNYIDKNISNVKLDKLKEIQINKTISILPQPIINIFSHNFNKQDVVHFSTASFLYGNLEYGGGTLNIGSAIMTMYIIFGYWIFIILFIFFIPVFIFMDSFYNKQKMIFSPYIIIFFYSTSGGILNFISATELSFWLNLIFRIIPQTLIIIFIAKFAYNKFLKKI